MPVLADQFDKTFFNYIANTYLPQAIRELRNSRAHKIGVDVSELEEIKP